jgi:hypothetical protein
MRTRSVLIVLSLAACGGHHGGDDDSGVSDGGTHGAAYCAAGLDGITLSPATSTLQLDGSAAPPTVTFEATGHFADGHTEALDVGDLDWTPSRDDDTDPGTAALGVFTPFPAAGGRVTVTASASPAGEDPCAAGTAIVDLHLDAVIGDPPPDPADWNGTPVTAGAPTIVYPSAATVFPRNIFRTLFQWRSAGFAELRLTFDGPGSTVTVYTDGVHDLCLGASPAAGCWEADETAWSFIAASNAGEQVDWTVDALDRSTTPPTVRRAGPIQIAFSKRDVTGAIFYWSTTSAGVRRASVTAELPEDYISAGTSYIGPESEVRCVACHVVSRDGAYLVAPVDASDGKSLWITQVTESAPPDRIVTGVPNTEGHGFATISPDNEYVVANWGGALWQVDRATGAYLADITVPTEATHPDWSPDGDRMAYATAKGDSPAGASLATIPYSGGTTWGSPTILVPAATNQSCLFPQFSHEGEHIAFARGKGGHGDITAQLWVIGKDGGTPIEMVAANRVVNNATGDGQHQNSQPTWGPSGDYQWVAFNSKRAYGVVSNGGMQQIWVAAVDPVKLAAGIVDPSFPAFRLQFQGLDENNHRAYWTEDIRDNPPPPPEVDGGVCVAAGDDCIPGVDACCDRGYVCDTEDDGATYQCLQTIIP